MCVWYSVESFHMKAFHSLCNVVSLQYNVTTGTCSSAVIFDLKLLEDFSKSFREPYFHTTFNSLR